MMHMQAIIDSNIPSQIINNLIDGDLETKKETSRLFNYLTSHLDEKGIEKLTEGGEIEKIYRLIKLQNTDVVYVSIDNS